MSRLAGRSRRGVRSNRSTPPSTTARAPSPTSSIAAPPRAPQRQQLGEPRGGARAQPAGGVLGEPPHDEPRERGRQRGEVAERDAVAPGERGVDHDVEHLGLVAQQLGGAQQVRLGGRVQLAQRGERPRANPRRA